MSQTTFLEAFWIILNKKVHMHLSTNKFQWFPPKNMQRQTYHFQGFCDKTYTSNVVAHSCLMQYFVMYECTFSQTNSIVLHLNISRDTNMYLIYLLYGCYFILNAIFHSQHSLTASTSLPFHKTLSIFYQIDAEAKEFVFDKTYSSQVGPLGVRLFAQVFLRD